MLAATFLRRSLCATTALALALPAGAQTVETPTPPARVGQIAGLLGDVSFNGAGSNGAWVAAAQNYPLTAGDSLYTAAGAEAAVALDSSRLTIAPLTELQVTSLDDEAFTATQAQGEMVLDLTALAPGQSFTIQTPGGTIAIATSGEYDIIAGPTTTVSVLSGEATAGNITLYTGQAVTLTDGQAQVAALDEDDFVRHVLGEQSPPPPPYVPQIADQMTGADELSGYGNWDQDADYGAVWYPNVGADWAPYREGAWSYVAPWGWTWVEAEPWGFAPFHYGRWIERGARWGWVPAADRDEAAGYTPVYAPAIVSFFGLATGAAITADILSSGRIGWVPLAPGEPYHPPYSTSASYIARINRSDIARTTDISRSDSGIDHYANRAGATLVPAAAMARGERIGRAGGGGVPPGDFAHARPAEGLVNQAIRPAMTARPAMNTPRPETPRPESPGDATRATFPRPDIPRAEAPLQAPRNDTPRPDMPRLETPQAQAPRLEASPPRVDTPRLEAPHAQNAVPFAPAQAPRMEAPRVFAPRAEAPRPPPPMNNPRPPG
jgi:hypothetical protein